MKNKIRLFFVEKLWSDELFKGSFWFDYLIKRLRILFLVLKGFYRHECFTRATALTYISVLAFIPLLALIFYIVSLSANENLPLIETFLNNFFRPAEGSQDVASANSNAVNPFVSKVLYFVKNIDLKNFGIFGILLLIITAVSLVNSIESTLNKIWGLDNDRSWLKKIPVYSFVLMTLPFFVILSVTLSASFHAFAVAKTQGAESLLEHWMTRFYLLDVLISWTKYFLHMAGGLFANLIPFMFSWVAFLMLYYYLPNTKVRFKYGAIGALVGAVLFEFAKPLFTHYVSEFAASSNITKIYGVLSFLPITLLWVYVIWLIVLFGAELTYAIQNVKMYQRGLQLEWLNRRSKDLIVLKFVNLIVIEHQQKECFQLDALLEKFNVPESFLHSSLQVLIESEVIIALDADNTFKLIRPVEDVTPYFILKILREKGNDYGEELKSTFPYLDDFMSSIESENIDFPFQLSKDSETKD